ncbi:Flp pilus assembly protein CpaB [Actibacterium sp. XHP0104]|uniref:Flp pilus assembly protein CpaB n=1 Tax=Actibacterium sp. XHP0104 TaxID=2984335 RepID=UPI0021E8E04B|nr:Flp pilus assembly protein CpaB [Actibacterium sp. XHP0104]MCV2882968.1 Flp pilus assembly protein CpaB [Actibacterium sp. XHP0104]
MRIKSFIITLVGVGMAAGSVFLAKDYIGKQEGAAVASASQEMVDIVVAREDIDFGQPIGLHSLTTQAWPANAVPNGAYTSVNALVSTDPDQSRRALTRLYQGEVVLSSKLSRPGERVTIVQKLGENTRAMAIKVDATTAVGGFVTPGDFVDIVLTEGGSSQLRAGTILQNIRVIGVDQQSEENSDQPVVARTVTVEVTADQGQRLALAQRAGTLSLTLRTLNSVENEELELIQLDDLFHNSGPKEVVEVNGNAEPAPAPAPVRRSVTVRRGVTEETVYVK